ncbi:PREDICTED: serine/threonine-protein phosphatase 2A regulatory subunit B'' subunit beta-like, partial [Galeopterus variegatus]|uniref:Serine/threonine-protein phosphatase 2A regulatory subunit B'' subunit beta-like n=1 Tax=Galeopterus variegatus TaxID=482537 RepID=A0ABM0Q1M0_GALVR
HAPDRCVSWTQWRLPPWCCGLKVAVCLSAAAIHSVQAPHVERGAVECLELTDCSLPSCVQACGCPLYWKGPLFCGAGGERTGCVSVHKFVAMWRKILQTCHDDAAKFVHLLMNPGCNYLVQEDFVPFLQDVVNTHPGLSFLKEASEFHSCYITTGVTWTEATRQAAHEPVSSFAAISTRMVDRIFSGAVTRGRKVQKAGKISYADFVWFLISEEDKKTPTSIEYWFRCMDLDGDGALSMFELEYFYEEQCRRLDSMAIEALPFEDCLCQMLDLVKPQNEGKITLHDLKQCKFANVFFDTFFNIEKYLDHKQKEQVSLFRESESDGPELSDWEKYAAEEYDILVAEKAAGEPWDEGSPLDPSVIVM